MQSVVLSLLMLLAAAAAAPQAVTARTSTTVSAQDVYDSLPEEEREPFLAYELALGLEQVARSEALAVQGAEATAGSLAQQLHDAYGIPEHLRRKFEKLPAPNNFDINMYGWVKKSTDPTFQQMVELAARGQYCIGNGPCFTLQEPFGNCCPF